jgi:hypothetical protein
LTKEQQADLIIKVTMQADKDRAEGARSFSPHAGKRGGSTKDTFKEKVVKEAQKYGIGKRTVEKSMAKERRARQKPPHADTKDNQTNKEDQQAKKGTQEFEASIGRKKKVDRKKPSQTLSNTDEAIKRIEKFINAELSRVQREEERTQIVQGLKRIVERLLAREGIEEAEIQPPRSSRTDRLKRVKRKTTRGRRTRGSSPRP